MATNMDYSSLYGYQKPQNTYTIDQFIACQSDNVICYNNLSFLNQYDGIAYSVYNVLSDYLDEIRSDYCLSIKLNEEQFLKYKYRPKLLCYDIYGNGELAFIIMIINDICSVKDFTKKQLLMPTKENMSTITNHIFNSNKNSINLYNEKNKE